MEGPVRPYQPTSSSTVVGRQPRRSPRCGRSANAISPATRWPPIWRPTNSASAQHRASRELSSLRTKNKEQPAAAAKRRTPWRSIVPA